MKQTKQKRYAAVLLALCLCCLLALFLLIPALLPTYKGRIETYERAQKQDLLYINDSDQLNLFGSKAEDDAPLGDLPMDLSSTWETAANYIGIALSALGVEMDAPTKDLISSPDTVITHCFFSNAESRIRIQDLPITAVDGTAYLLDLAFSLDGEKHAFLLRTPEPRDFSETQAKELYERRFAHEEKTSVEPDRADSEEDPAVIFETDVSLSFYTLLDQLKTYNGSLSYSFEQDPYVFWYENRIYTVYTVDRPSMTLTLIFDPNLPNMPFAGAVLA